MTKSELNQQRQGNSLNTVLVQFRTGFREVLTNYVQDTRKGSKLYDFQLLHVMSLLHTNCHIHEDCCLLGYGAV